MTATPGAKPHIWFAGLCMSCGAGKPTKPTLAEPCPGARRSADG